MSKAAPFEPGQVFRVVYPFVREEFDYYDTPTATWKPGHCYEYTGGAPDDPDCEAVSDGNGELILTIISIHSPRPFPTRIFYTRKWRAPDGSEFGKRKLLIATIPRFRSLTTGYMSQYPGFKWRERIAAKKVSA